MSSLTVYKASAGSGKTFTLAVAYIKLLVANPASYRNILAVTFTNKATEEMKTRILSQLYGISRGLAESDDYLKKIALETQMAEDDIRKAASAALSLLIHNYDYFHVETIDTFFQSVLRNLARELDLSANLRVELNDTAVENQAVDLMIEELDRKSPLFSWIVRFIMENIDKNNSWNIIGSVKDFGRMIFNDQYREIGKAVNEKLSDSRFLTSYRTKLRAEEIAAREILKETSSEFFRLIGKYGIQEEDFKGGQRSGIQKYFHRLAEDDLSDRNFIPKTVANCMESEENWVAKTNKNRDLIIRAARESLMPLLERAEKERTTAATIVNSVAATFKNINNLRLLRDIENKVKEMNAEANRFLLSDTQHLLRMMINDSDSPFIFEKIGTHLNHIMIDEFQDTSVVQWNNFKVLLGECLSHAKTTPPGVTDNLIVGDIKQSIYRWRAGEWSLLSNIAEAFPGYSVNVESLDTNYRSEQNIIRFNNAFFRSAIAAEFANESNTDQNNAQQINTAYADVEQKTIKREAKGLVSVRLLPTEGYEENTFAILADTIHELLQRGVRQRDIAILLRSNRYIPVLANYFTECHPDINIVSDEAFRLDHSVAVCCIIDALRYLYGGDDVLTRACLTKKYSLATGNDTFSGSQMTNMKDLGDNLLPEEYTAHQEELKELPLFELCEELLHIFRLDRMKEDGAYICAFFDYLNAYIKDMSADVAGFLREWDENLHSRTIQTDDIDGLRIISIHKSKGLEFDNVIIPFCDWKLELYGNNIWCHPAVEPFSQLPLIPISYSPTLAKSIYADDYKYEHMQNTIDNLNLLYVAFTRPKKNLFVVGKRNAAGTRSMLIEQSLAETAQSLKGATIEGKDDNSTELTFTYGEFCPGKTKEEDKKSGNVFLKQDISVAATIEHHEIPLEFRQSNNSKKFIQENNGEEQEENTEPKADYISTGNILHQIFSGIKTAADVESELDRFEAEGILYGDNLDQEKLQSLLNGYLTGNELVADWFSPRWTLFNECTIICEETDEKTGKKEIVARRPDRVMKDGDEVVVVDFKFGKPNEKYATQVRQYIGYLRQMGYANVRGYIWYVFRKEIKEVEK